MLPFLKNKQEGSISEAPDAIERKPDQEKEYDSLYAAAEELISAVHVKDVDGVATALRSAFTIMESEPHEEDKHVG
jgi:hypothetical protein